ncbi:hypothetical protein OIU84_024224 [Salix udensis]|uniref:Uncharacterized protein n=1 Tax=Salix udensis TaxID=889485 RepID=A0AAD6KGW0_9ROSI|nr:hypothetical protein OIU84_024224 [Salix udensis]
MVFFCEFFREHSLVGYGFNPKHNPSYFRFQSSKVLNFFLPKPHSQFLGLQRNVGWLRPCRIGPSNGSRAKCWFKFGKNGVDAEGAGIYGSQSRDDFDRDDVEQVFLSFSLF